MVFLVFVCLARVAIELTLAPLRVQLAWQRHLTMTRGSTRRLTKKRAIELHDLALSVVRAQGTPTVDGRYQEAMTLAKAKGVTKRPR